jgi:outer membrane protein
MKNIIGMLLVSIFVTLAQANKNTELQTGLAVIHSSKVYKGTSSKTHTIPLVIARYNDFYIEGLAIGYKLFNDKSFTTSLELSSDFLGYRNSDNTYLSTLEDKKSTLNAVLKSEYSVLNDLKLIGKFHYDISNKYNSYSAEVGVEYMLFQKQNHTLVSNLAIEYMDKKKSNYYYGVAPHEVNADIYSYEANKAFNSTFGLKYIYNYSDRWSFFGDMQRTFLDNSISNSPIVTTDHKHTFLIGVLYAW